MIQINLEHDTIAKNACLVESNQIHINEDQLYFWILRVLDIVILLRNYEDHEFKQFFKVSAESINKKIAPVNLDIF